MSHLVYLKLDAQHPQYASTIASLGADFAEEYPNNILSVNVNDAGTFAWVKALAESVVPEDVLVTTEPLSNASAVAAETNTVEWRALGTRDPRNHP